MTDAQQKVVDRLRELGGCAWLGNGVDREKGIIHGFASQMTNCKKWYGKREFERIKKIYAKHKITNKGVWCSSVTMHNLIEAGIIEPLEEIGGVWKLTEAK